MREFELSILDWIQLHLRSEVMDQIMVTVTRFGNSGIGLIAVIILLLAIPKTRKVGKLLAISLIIEAVICNLVLKTAFGRIRPYEYRDGLVLLINKPIDTSFPSGHTGAAFSFVSALFFSKNKWWILAFVVAACIAFSRLYLYVHFPTDILGGILVGILGGYLGHMIVTKREKSK